jgi:lactate dehydrogenase-like 2-hydroxyacid dehydrogenase
MAKLAPIISPNKKKAITVETVIEAVSKYYDITPDKLLSNVRSADIVNARSVAMYICRDLLEMQLTKIGEYFGGKKHTTVLHALNKVTDEELFKSSDIITLHCPLTDNTREMICAESIGKMKKGVIVVNTGRGPLVNEQDMAAALKKGRVGAFCADVLSAEPPSSDNPLFSCPNAFITPHIAWASHEARARLIHIAAQNLRAFISGQPQNTV